MPFNPQRWFTTRVLAGRHLPILSYEGSSQVKLMLPIAVAERSRARTVFARSNTAIVGLNPTEAWMFVCVFCVRFFCFCSLK
jgi:hypothetical protein